MFDYVNESECIKIVRKKMSKSPVLLNFRLMKDDKAARKVVVRKNQFSMQRREFLYGTATVHYINVINFCDLLFSNEN